MSNKLDIATEMQALDNKDRDFFDSLTEQEQAKFSPFVLLRWASCVNTNNLELEKYYLLSTNQQANRYFWAASKHKKLQWLLLTTISPGMGTYRHDYIRFNNSKPKNRKAQLLTELFPDIKTSDAEFLSTMVSDEEIQQRLEELGYDHKQIKEAMK